MSRWLCYNRHILSFTTTFHYSQLMAKMISTSHPIGSDLLLQKTERRQNLIAHIFKVLESIYHDYGTLQHRVVLHTLVNTKYVIHKAPPDEKLPSNFTFDNCYENTSMWCWFISHSGTVQMWTVKHSSLCFMSHHVLNAHSTILNIINTSCHHQC